MNQLSQSISSSARLQPGLGTFIAVDAEAPTPEIHRLGTAAAFAATALVGRLMHPLREGSDLARLHGWPSAVPMPVHAWTWAVLQLCKRLHTVSDGVFDPSVPESPNSFDALELVPPHNVVLQGRVHIDVGGIAKGFAVDRAVDALREAGCLAGLVNAGGDLALFGPQEREILLRRQGRHMSRVTLHNAALAHSEVDNQSRPGEHRGYYNRVDGRRILSGSVTVTAHSAAIADGLTKCLLAGDSAQSASLLEMFDARRVG